MRANPLPIDDALPEIIAKLKAHGAVVLKAEPGAGKTTRVPPAILDAGLAELESKRPGLIVVLQPRRIAARSAAVRISDERGTELGGIVGYQVRHEGKTSKQTRILVCTEGVFLRKLQDDPLLDDVAAVVFDEFHERSIDSDLALAMARQVRAQVRPDLRIVVMSATLEPGPIAQYLDNCPSVESPGRTFPIDIQFLDFPANGPLPQVTADGVVKTFPKTEGHLLVFLPGIGEIRQTAEILEGKFSDQEASIMALYGDLSLEEQQQVLRPSKARKIILSTNVAETSLTIDGVTAVVDSGMARVNRFHPQLGLNRLELERISKASADQRAGRAGRLAPGQCLRLWTQREHHGLSDFEAPEIARVELSQFLLQLIAWGEHDVAAFPFFEAPPPNAVERALTLLEMLDAIDAHENITETGRRMARLPVQPRLARLIVEGESLGHGNRAALCAALLSERDPFRREDKRDARGAQHSTSSDVLDRLSAVEEFDQNKVRDSWAGTIMPGAAKQVLLAGRQLARLSGGDKNSNTKSDEAIMRALVTSFPDRVCKRRQPNDRRALMVGGRGVKLAEESAVDSGDLFLAVELLDSGQSESLVRQASLVERSWLPSSQLATGVEVAYDAQRQKVVAFKRTRYRDLVLDEGIAQLPADVDPGAMLAQGIRANMDLSALVDEQAHAYLARLQCLREWLPELNFPDFGSNPWEELLPEWCSGCTSVSELRAETLIGCMQSRLTQEQLMTVDSEAPERIMVPSGKRHKIEYKLGEPPVLAVRIQELFGLAATPRIARGRIPLLLHLLAPNFRPQQITPDLGSFWKNTYPQVKKDLKARYPKHAWPDDPLQPLPPKQSK